MRFVMLSAVCSVLYSKVLCILFSCIEIHTNTTFLQHSINCKKLINGEFVDSNNTKIMDFLNEKVVARTVQSKMLKSLEEWANVKLNKNGLMYGIRRYTRG